ncbi:hypothetical protein FB567DRAFT_599475 [Paraphoma chrysanthemicola]|uniref:RING-type domain-containing protein n=1 Tax=Paraphoma chrysanthemicola TaxID=798071 RepID=A0A8K0QRS5_9PLEO|nr:hypothetical protein FB567DRAFT_599475 [Paraphoma chrysanthemicola]
MSSAPEDDDNKIAELEKATPLNTVSPSAVAAALMQNLTFSPGGCPQPVEVPMPSLQGDDMATPGSSPNLTGDDSIQTTPTSTPIYPEEFLASPLLQTPTSMTLIPAAPFFMGIPIISGPNGLPTETTFAEALAQLAAGNPIFYDHVPQAPRFDSAAFVDSLERVDISTIPAEDMKYPHCWLPFGTTADDDPSFIWAPHPEATPELAERNAALRELPFSRANNDPVRTPCGHIFGRDCLIRSMEDVNTLCPTCRQELLSESAAGADDETDSDSDGDDEEGEGDDDDDDDDDYDYDYDVEDEDDNDDGNGIDWEFGSEDIDEIIDSHDSGATQEIGPHDSHEEGTGETDEDDAGDDKDSMADESAGIDQAGKVTGV